MIKCTYMINAYTYKIVSIWQHLKSKVYADWRILQKTEKFSWIWRQCQQHLSFVWAGKVQVHSVQSMQTAKEWCKHESLPSHLLWPRGSPEGQGLGALSLGCPGDPETPWLTIMWVTRFYNQSTKRQRKSPRKWVMTGDTDSSLDGSIFDSLGC